MFLEESDEAEKYVGGLLDMLEGSVMASMPKTMQDAIEIANDLMDQNIRTFAERQTENKRKLDNDNRAQQQPPKNKNVARGEIKKLEIKLWNLKVKGNDVPTYTKCFQELTLICTKFVANETEKIDKYVSGLPDNIYGSVKASKPKTLDETIELANDLMDQKLRTYAERQMNNKRKVDDSFRNNHGYFKRDCLKLKNKDRGNVNAQEWVYAVGNAEKKGNASRDPDSNVVMGTFLLNNCYASILFDTSTDRSFILTAFSSLIDIVPTLLGNSYDVELADGKIVGAHISAKKEEDKSEGKQLKDVPIVRDFPEVFPEDFSGLPPARPVEF
uniref:Reverse transcriptase domain-containing protein n=1 Tax=Tanacetum cinerariifolium TaxID=118510 RepID=A0A699HV02_TANCI|nr:hypothetical protein [Tanacetum cinerariifolium]